MCRTASTSGITVSSIQTVLWPACANRPVRSKAQRQYEATDTVAEMVSVDLQEGLRVLVEDGPVRTPVWAEARVLRAPFPGDDEEGGERREDEEPIGEPYVRDDAAGDSAQHEGGRDDGELDHGLLFQPEAVGHVQRGVGPDHDRQAPWAEHDGAGEPERDEAHPGAERGRGPELAAGHRTLPLHRVVTVRCRRR